MLLSWSCDVFIRPGQLGFFWPTRLSFHSTPKKTNPIPKNYDDMGTFVRFMKLFYWKLIFLGDLGKRNWPNQIIIWTSQTSYWSVCDVQIMIWFRPTGYSDFQSRIGFRTACQNPNHNFCFSSGNKIWGTWKYEQTSGFDDARCCLLYTSPSPRD